MSKKILVLWGSIRKKEKSFSYELLNRFLKYYKEKNKDDSIEFMDLNKEEVAQKVMTNENFTKFFADKDCDKHIDKLKKIDKVIIACPMINFNVPTIVKNYLDHILVANKTFSFKYSEKNGSIGLLKNLKVQILVTQGAPHGWYKWGSVENYLTGTWHFTGAKVNEPIVIAGTEIPENANKSIDHLINKYDEKIKKIASSF